MVGEGARIEAGARDRRRGAPGPGRGRIVSDALAEVRATDRANQLDDVLALPEQLSDALWRVESARLEPFDAVGGLVVCGMGGSAIGGDLAAVAFGSRLSRPLDTARSYELPSCMLPDRAVLCSSYSGDTEETIACYEAAEALGARRIVATTGGELAAAARRDGVPVIGLPAGPPAPRRGRLPVHGRRRGRRAGRSGARDPDRDRQLGRPPAGGQRLARRARRRARRAARGIDPGDLRRGPDGARRRSLEDPDQRERQAARLRGRAARGRPQRDRRLGGARARRVASAPSSSRTGTSTHASGSASS